MWMRGYSSPGLKAFTCTGCAAFGEAQHAGLAAQGSQGPSTALLPDPSCSCCRPGCSQQTTSLLSLQLWAQHNRSSLLGAAVGTAAPAPTPAPGDSILPLLAPRAIKQDSGLVFPIFPSYFGPGTAFSSALSCPLPVFTSGADTQGSRLCRAGLGKLP